MPRVASRLGLPTLLLTLLAACDGAAPAGPGPDAEFKPGAPSRLSNQIEIRLDVQPDGPADVGFSATGVKASTFILDDDADPLRSNARVVTTPQPGTYTVVLTSLPVGYDLVGIYCQSFANGGTGVNNTSINVPLSTATITLEPFERVTCTFVVDEDLGAAVTVERAAD